MDNTKLEIEKALKKWKRIKVSKLAITNDREEGNYESYFDYIWWRSLHEYDLYRENEIDEEEDHLDKRSATTTLKWLKENQNLTTEFKDVKITE